MYTGNLWGCINFSILNIKYYGAIESCEVLLSVVDGNLRFRDPVEKRKKNRR
jgi:hypothetical protein